MLHRQERRIDGLLRLPNWRPIQVKPSIRGNRTLSFAGKSSTALTSRRKYSTTRKRVRNVGLRLTGLTYPRIAEELGIHEVTVTRMMKELILRGELPGRHTGKNKQ